MPTPRRRTSRLAAAALTCGLALTACSGTPQPPPAPASPAPGDADPTPTESPTPSPTASPAPRPATRPGQTAPEKLDGALLQEPDLPGWSRSGDTTEYANTTVEPASCDALHRLTVGKVASDMGAMAAFSREDLFLQQYLEVVDRGTDSVDAAERLLSTCGHFTMIDADEKTPVTVTRFDVPGIGDRAVGLKVTMQGEAPVDLFVIIAGHKDVVLTTALQGAAPQQAMAVDLTKKALEKATKSL